MAAHARQLLGEFVVQVHEDAGAGGEVLDEPGRRLAADERAQGLVVEAVVGRAEEDHLEEQRVERPLGRGGAFPDVHEFDDGLWFDDVISEKQWWAGGGD